MNEALKRPHSGRVSDGSGRPTTLLDTQFLDLLDGLNEAFYIVDEHWRIVTMNRLAEELCGRLRQQLVGRDLCEAFPQARGTPAGQELFAAMRERRAAMFEYHEDAPNRWYDLRSHPYGNGMAIFLRDITERKRAEIERERLITKLDESRRLFQGIAETTPNLQYVFDLITGCVIYAGGRSEQVFGYTAREIEDMGARAVPTLVHPDDYPGVVEHLGGLQQLADGEISSFEFRSLFPDGSCHWLQTNASVFARTDTGRVWQIIGVTQDITTHKQAEAALRRTHDELEAEVAERTRELAAANAALNQENSERRRAEQARQQLLEQLVDTQERERRRIARELHDSLGQYLTALRMGLETTQAQEDCPPALRDSLQRLCRLALTLDGVVDRLAFELRPPVLDDLGLGDALGTLVREWSATSNIPVDVYIGDSAKRRLPAALETTIYRIVQEALTNILKHATATSVSLVVEQRAEEVLAIIEDDGAGFDLLAVTQPRDMRQQFGLKGIRERVALVGGQLEIETAPGTGTAIYVRIPLPPDTGDGAAEERP